MTRWHRRCWQTEFESIARSFKYHRPRGIVGAGFEEPNALVQLQGTSEEPNVLATCLPLMDHLHAKSQNCWPGPRFDLGSVNDRISRLIPAGFYYKTFMWRPWNSYARVIRKAAGLGQVPKTTESESYEKTIPSLRHPHRRCRAEWPSRRSSCR